MSKESEAPNQGTDSKEVTEHKGKVDTTKSAVISFEPFMINKTFNAPKELLFNVWTEPKHIQKWFGPKGVEINVDRMDFRPGGTYNYFMTTPDNIEMWGRFFYREITPPKKIIWVNSFSDPEGAIARHPMGGAWPVEMLTTVTFSETDGKTLVKVEWLPINCTEEEIRLFANARPTITQSWNGTFAVLEDYLKIIS